MAKGQSEADEIKERMLRGKGKLDPHDPEVVYMPPEQGPFMCDHCEYFLVPNACQKVEGFIDPHGCCNLYEKNEEHFETGNDIEDDDDDG